MAWNWRSAPSSMLRHRQAWRDTCGLREKPTRMFLPSEKPIESKSCRSLSPSSDCGFLSAYNLLFGIRLSGTLDKGAFHSSLNEIVRRHEVLRTTFHEKNGVPEQKISD